MNLDELERLADAATPGPWGCNEASGLDDCLWSDNAQAWVIFNDSFETMRQCDADFIAAANPSTVKELVQLVRQCKNALTYVNDWAALDALTAIEKWENGK